METRAIVVYCYEVQFLDERDRVQRVRVSCRTSDAVHFSHRIQPYLEKGWKFRSIVKVWTREMTIDR